MPEQEPNQQDVGWWINALRGLEDNLPELPSPAEERQSALAEKEASLWKRMEEIDTQIATAKPENRLHIAELEKRRERIQGALEANWNRQHPEAARQIAQEIQQEPPRRRQEEPVSFRTSGSNLPFMAGNMQAPEAGGGRANEEVVRILQEISQTLDGDKTLTEKVITTLEKIEQKIDLGLGP